MGVERALSGNPGFLLRGLEVTPLRFRVKAGRGSTVQGIEAAVIAYIGDHPGARVNDVWLSVPPLNEWEYERARTLVAGLVDKGALAIDGEVPLEEVDLRYERLAACDLCGSASSGHGVVLWKHNTPVVRCSECGLLYANPRWKAEFLFGRYDTGYWEEYAGKTERAGFDPATNEKRWRHLITHLEPSRQFNRMLDVGCATGGFMLAAQGRGWDVYGVETSPIAAEEARRRTGAQIHMGTLDMAPFAEGWFDAITLWDVIEHVQSPRAYLAHAARLVRPGGFIALTTPNVRSIAFRLLGREWPAIGPNDHLYYFAPLTMSRLLASSGFRIHSMTTWKAKAEVWQQWLRFPRLNGLAAGLSALTKPLAERFLLGDDLYVVGRRDEKSEIRNQPRKGS